MIDKLNPYLPAATVSNHHQRAEDASNSTANFRLTRRILKRAEDQFLLHRHMTRLSFASLGLILLSLVILVQSSSLGGLAFALGAITSLFGSTFIYLALIHRSKKAVRANLPAMGLVDGAVCEVTSTPDEFVLVTPQQTIRWPNSSIKTHRFRGGFLVCPESPKSSSPEHSSGMSYAVVPKAGEFASESYYHFRKRVERRAIR